VSQPGYSASNLAQDTELYLAPRAAAPPSSMMTWLLFIKRWLHARNGRRLAVVIHESYEHFPGLHILHCGYPLSALISRTSKFYPVHFIVTAKQRARADGLAVPGDRD